MGGTFLNKCKFRLFNKKRVYNNKCEEINVKKSYLHLSS